jgi:hypothetical protein
MLSTSAYNDFSHQVNIIILWVHSSSEASHNTEFENP